MSELLSTKCLEALDSAFIKAGGQADLAYGNINHTYLEKVGLRKIEPYYL